MKHWRALLSLCLLMLAQVALAHESRPAYLEINETGPGRYELLWRTPVLSGMRLPVELQFAQSARNVSAPTLRELPDSLLERRVIELPGGLAGTRIDFTGLEGTLTDVLVRVQSRDAPPATWMVHPSQPWLDVAAARTRLEVAGTYLWHGVDHILLGYDHLLFVFALVLIVRGVRPLLWNITAFTLAHSITLALATMGTVRIPGPPVEAAIALSILLLAGEIVRQTRGETGLTARWPWLVAFTFGLLHGFGFAGALSEIGLPRGDIPLALFSFNVGVELGQLAFVGVVLSLFALVKRFKRAPSLVHALRPAAPYGIGSLAAFWFFERLAGFWL